MELQELVRAIAREVISQVGNVDGKSVQAISRAVGEKRAAAAAPELPWLRILGKVDCPWAAQVANAFHGKARILYLDDDADGATVERHVLPRLSLTLMADLAQGRASHSFGERLLKLLLSGVGIEAFSMEYKEFETTAPSALIQLYKAHEASLASFGLTGMKVAVDDTRGLSSALVTEGDVIAAGKDGVTTLSLPKTALVTPLALDSARELNIKLVKR